MARLKPLEAEIARLKQLVAKRDLEIEVTKELAGERAGSSASSCVAASVANGPADLHAQSNFMHSK